MTYLARTILSIIAFLPLMAAAQRTVVISGRVTDTKGTPLGQVAVAVLNTQTGTYSDDKGAYRLEVPEGELTLTASLLGYERQSRSVTAHGKKMTVNFSLKETAVDISSVAVFGKSNTQRLREGVYSISTIDVREVANRITNVSDIVNRASGVKIRNEGGLGSDFELSLNGMSGNSVRYFIDGVPLSILGSGVSLENIPVSTVERVEIYKGVVPAHLGADALGGAINIITNRKRHNYLDASVSAGSFHTYTADVNGQWQDTKSGVIIRPSIGYSNSKNDYKMKNVEMWNEEAGYYLPTERKRFHDDYSSIIAQIEAGVENKPWADAFYISGGYSGINKELQTGATQNVVYGKAERQQDAWSLQARYKKENFLLKGLSANILASQTWDNSLTVDTAFRKYDWNGAWTPTSRNEITGRARQMRRYKRPLTVVRANFAYDINSCHALNFNYMFTRTGNKRTDDLGEDPEFAPSNDVMAKHIFSLAYNQSLLSGKINNVLFMKDYVNYVSVEQHDLYWITNSMSVPDKNTNNNLGYGLGTRITLCEPFALKASYERTARLPLARELLGNGSTVYPNLALRPEKSHNINAGFFGSARFGADQQLHYEGGLFYRKVEDYIYCIISEAEGMGQYANVSKVTMKGLEGEVRYSAGDWLQASVNCSYQNAINMDKYKDDGKPSITYKNKVPNRPWLFGNADVTLTKRHLFNGGDRLRFSYLYQYVHWFYLTWEGFGALESKAKIPTQNIHTLALTYSWQKERYNLTLECDNLFDCTAYDNYKLQKPGRSLMCKFRLFLH